MKDILGIIFGLIFKLFKVFPVEKNKITFIMTHDDRFNGNIKYIYEEIVKKYPYYKINIINRRDYDVGKITSILDIFILIKKAITVYIIKNYHLATSKYVFLNNIFITAAYLRFKKEVKVIQVWHAIGTFKKFGEEYIPSKKIDKIQKRANSIYTDVVVCSDKDIEVYSKAFDVSNEKVKALGSPICDMFENKIRIENIKEKILIEYPEIINKTVYLYAPTFRNDDKDNKKILKYIDFLSDGMSADSIMMIRLHPHVYKNYNYKIKNNKVIDVSDYDDVNELMIVSDVLITDYSSLFYEFTYLEKPIMFFAFDLYKYEEERGFYYDYKKYVPGNIFYDPKDVIKAINNKSFENMSKEFKNEYYDFFDGKSSNRIIDYYMK